MARRGRTGRRTQSNDPLNVVRQIQTALEDGENAVCLAARTGEDYEVGVTCDNSARERRHSISNSAYLTQIAECGLVLSTLPIDASHISHYVLKDSRRRRKGQPGITHLPPKPTPLDDASAWHFACQEHDAKFKPIDLGIPFPNTNEYMRLTAGGSTGAAVALEEALFLMAYRSVLSALSILRGVRKALVELRIQKGSHQSISQHAIEVTKRYDLLMEYKRQFDGRFAGVRSFDMTHHIMSARSHTGLAASLVGPYATTNILPDGGITRIVVSHASDESKERRQEIEVEIANLTKGLSDKGNKRAFIDLVANSFDSYVSPADYKKWAEEDKDALMRTAAKSVMQYL